MKRISAAILCLPLSFFVNFVLADDPQFASFAQDKDAQKIDAKKDDAKKGAPKKDDGKKGPPPKMDDQKFQPKDLPVPIPTPPVPLQPGQVNFEPTSPINTLPTSTAPEMFGDLSPLPGQNGQIPRMRGFKVADNESPDTMDRVYFGFNYYNNVYGSSTFSGSSVHNNLYQETIGIEKTFLDGNASFGIQVPIDTLNTTGAGAASGTNSAVGDLAMILKFALWRNAEKGDVVSGGMAVVVPTGPNALGSFAGAVPSSLNSTTIQPFVGYLYQWERLYVHGFTEVDVPVNSNDVTLFYEDIGVGYWVYRSSTPAFITGIAPTLEAHASIPLNHQGLLHSADPAGTPNVFDFTYGVNFEIEQSVRFGVAVVTPITGPKPYDFEVIAQLRFSF